MAEKGQKRMCKNCNENERVCEFKNCYECDKKLKNNAFVEFSSLDRETLARLPMTSEQRLHIIEWLHDQEKFKEIKPLVQSGCYDCLVIEQPCHEKSEEQTEQ